MISVVRLEGSDLLDRARLALVTLAARPGFVSGHVGRGTDDPADWVLVTEWESVGAYRRALGSYDVKLHAVPLLSGALDTASSFEALVSVRDGRIAEHASDRAGGG